MHSPLPDASALEAGIIEDARPSRLSRVQDNVRNLLRASLHGGVLSSPLSSPAISPDLHRTPLPSPKHAQPYSESIRRSSCDTSSTSTGSVVSSPGSETCLLPEPQMATVQYLKAVQYVPHQSAMFNSRAVEALNNPDLSDPSLSAIIHDDVKCRQQHAWKRPKSRRNRKSPTTTQCTVCVLFGLVVIGLLTTYVVLAATSQLSPIFHIFFVFGVVLAALAFVSITVHICVAQPQSRRRRKHHVFANRHGRSRQRSDGRRAPDHGAHAYVPQTPVPVSIGDEDIRVDPHEAQPSAAVHQPPEVWDKNLASKVSNPPPAYGRWRGSVRADPELLHWQVHPAPTDASLHAIPSPIYEEMPSRDGSRSPPSYVTRESPGRKAEGADMGPAVAQAQIVEPEMVEGRGIGMGF